MLAAVRLRGSIKMRKDIKDALIIVGLKKVNTLILLEKNDNNVGMLRKVENFVAWGEISPEFMEKFGKNRILHLKHPKGGLKSIKKKFPKGNLGYCGEKINDLIMKMI